MVDRHFWLRNQEETAGLASTTRSFRALIRRFETQNSILAGQEVFHMIVKEPLGPIAATSENVIKFNSALLPSPDTADDIMFLTGVNNHELGHVMFTPTMFDIKSLYPGIDNHMVRGLIGDPVYLAVFNLLEDQREETLMCKRFANQRPYYIAAFVGHILKDESQYDTAYLYARGRRYLPVKLRRRLKKKFRVQAIIHDIRRIIDGYCKLNLFTSDGLWKANTYIRELVSLLKQHDLIPQTPTGLPDTSALRSCDHAQHSIVPSRYDDSTSHADKADTDAVAQAVRAVAADIDSDSGAQGSDSQHQAPNGSGEGVGQGQDAEDAQDGSDGDAAGSGEGAAGGESAGTGAGTEAPPTDEDVKRELSGLLDTATEDEATQEELRQAELYIRASRDVAAPRLREQAKIEPEMPGIARRIANVLRAAEAEADPYWLGGQQSGRLNVQAVMRGADREYVFDRWTDGGYGGNEQEWVVLLDCSGSMDGHLHTLSKVNWIVKKAADTVEAKLTTIAFGSGGLLVYGENDRAEGVSMPLMVDLGGTTPGRMLAEAHRLLVTSPRRQRGLLVMTDGSWQGGGTGMPGLYSSELVIKDLNDKGVLTHLVYFGDSTRIDAHGCKTSGGMKELTDLPGIFKDLVKSMITKAH
jgi:hypothetical protein